jgi:hypothetical protein
MGTGLRYPRGRRPNRPRHPSALQGGEDPTQGGGPARPGPMGAMSDPCLGRKRRLISAIETSLRDGDTDRAERHGSPPSHGVEGLRDCQGRRLIIRTDSRLARVGQTTSTHSCTRPDWFGSRASQVRPCRRRAPPARKRSPAAAAVVGRRGRRSFVAYMSKAAVSVGIPAASLVDPLSDVDHDRATGQRLPLQFESGRHRVRRLPCPLPE